MKIKKGFMLRNVGNKNVVVAIGAASLELNGLITLNDTGAFIWKMLQKGCEYNDILNAILKEFDTDEETAKQGIDAFLEEVKNAKLLEEENA